MPHIDQFLGLIVTGMVLYTGVVLWLARVQGTANAARDGVSRSDAEREKDNIAFNRRLERAEEVVGDLKALAESVKNLGETLARESRYSAERHADLLKAVEHAKNNAAMAKELATRRRGSGQG